MAEYKLVFPIEPYSSVAWTVRYLGSGELMAAAFVQHDLYVPRRSTVKGGMDPRNLPASSLPVG